MIRSIASAGLSVPILVLTDPSAAAPNGSGVHRAGAVSGPTPAPSLVGAGLDAGRAGAVNASLAAGAAGVVAKDLPGPDLAAAIRAVAAGHAVLAPPALRALLGQTDHSGPLGVAPPGDQPLSDPRLAGLTDREREVLVLVGRGMTNAEIAATLVVGVTTVKTHVGRLLTKLALRDRIAAAVLAYDIGLDPPRPPLTHPVDVTAPRT